ncbi:MAG: hypothetical protein ACI9WC_000138 [Arenicella sp.]|jgi:hypothetical protein
MHKATNKKILNRKILIARKDQNFSSVALSQGDFSA